MATSESIRAALRDDLLPGLFLGELGWDRPWIPLFAIDLPGVRLDVVPIAQKCGLHVFEIKSGVDSLPAVLQVAADREIAKRSPERLLIFSSDSNQVWRWPESRPSGGTRLVPHTYLFQNPNEDLVQRIARISFSIAEQNSLSLLSVRARVRMSLNAEQVTRRFYDAFRTQHGDLLSGIEGIDDGEDRSWYASLLMNRLMFIYFIQMKGFIGGDRNFLQTCLAHVEENKGQDEFHSFYRDVLVPLFHDGLGSERHEFAGSTIAHLLKNVPYVNGGIFELHAIESRYSIKVRDEYFQRIFDFFGGFTWHLDTRPSGNPNEINPDVLGYVFEQYINLTASGKRENGAYYTKQDVTGYMVTSTLCTHLLERLIATTGTNPFVHLQANPRLYLHEDRLYGWDTEGDDWLPLPSEVLDAGADTNRWEDLKATETYATICLPGETWLDVIERRQQVDRLVTFLQEGNVGDVRELITNNIDIRSLLCDSIRSLTDPDDVLTAWNETSQVTVLDPTCGSGAFLFAALDVLDEIYGVILDTVELHVRSGSTRAHEVLESITARRREGQNLAYFRLKHASLNNLHGVDLMAEAVEIAKLRLFLTLVSRLDSPTEMEPLPDLDFNLKAGNLLVGFRDMDDARGRVANSLESLPAILAIEPEANRLFAQRLEFLRLLEVTHDESEVHQLKADIIASAAALRAIADQAYFDATTTDLTLDEWKDKTKPLHWFIEFPLAIKRGGFDVVIGNPPYVNRNTLAYSFGGFKTDACTDIFASCMERSVSLCIADGVFSMIVPIAFQFSGDYATAREAMNSLVPWWCISTYSRNPAALFPPGVGVRPVIFVGIRGGARGGHVTETRRWNEDYRPYLFHATTYTRIVPKTLTEPWQRVGSTRLGELFDQLMALPGKLAEDTRRHGPSIGFKQTALYYMSVFVDEPPAWMPSGDLTPQTKVGRLNFQDERSRDLAYILLSGRVGMWWWSAIGDDFDVTGGLLMAFPIRIQSVESAHDELLELAAELRAEQQKHPLVTRYARKVMGNYDMLRCRHITDRADQLVLRALGLDDYWPDVLASNLHLVRQTGERPGTRREWPFPWAPVVRGTV